MNDHINEMLHWFPFAVKNYGKPDGLKQHIYSLTGLEVRDLEQVSWHQNQGVDTAVFLPKALGRGNIYFFAFWTSTCCPYSLAQDIQRAIVSLWFHGQSPIALTLLSFSVKEKVTFVIRRGPAA